MRTLITIGSGMRPAVGIAAVALVLALSAAGPAAAQLPPGNVVPNSPGVNDFSCKPPKLHRYPVVVIHGTGGDQAFTNQRIAPVLLRLGYCVFSLDYGGRALGDIPTSGKQVAAFIDRVLAATEARRVSLVGHSQGGMLGRYIVKFLKGAGKVDDVVGLVPSNHGTTTPLAPVVGGFCPACAQQAAGSAFITNLNRGVQAPAPVSFTQISTRYDEVVTPYTSAFLPRTPDRRVVNVTLQDACLTNTAEHVGIIFDGVALQHMLSALGRRGPANRLLKPDCTGARADTWPNTDSGTVPERGAAARRCAGTVKVRGGPRGRRGFRRAVAISRRRTTCRRARRVARNFLRARSRRARFGRWRCRARGRRVVRVRCVHRGGLRVSFRARRR